MNKLETLDVGVIVERRKIDNPWQEWSWRPVAVIPGAPPVEGWKQTVAGDGWTQFHAATVTVELHHKEVEGYAVTLQAAPPRLWVVLRENPAGGEFPYKVHTVTASAYRVEDYMDSAEEIVEPVMMPEPMVAWMAEFVEEYFVAEKFKKRTRDRVPVEKQSFGKEPIFERRQRGLPESEDG